MARKGEVQDLTGQRFGMLVALAHVGTNTSKQTMWMFLCDCGTQKAIPCGNVKAGNTVSCGCFIRKKTSERSLVHGGKANGAEMPEYKSWLSMRRRCCRPGSQDYAHYGGRGIVVCERWISSFSTFLADMGRRPSKRHSIDRINVNGNYEPGNCRWATPREQSGNKRNSTRVIIGGEEMCLTEAARRNGVSRYTAQARVKRGWDPLAAATEPARRFA